MPIPTQEVTERRRDLAQAYGLHRPKSVCRCGHNGDGEGSDHGETFQAGHGACLVVGCVCRRFTWVRFTGNFEAALAAVK